MSVLKSISLFPVFTLICLLSVLYTHAQEQPLPPPDTVTVIKVVKAEYGVNDTIFVKALVINGEILGGRDLSEIFVWGGNPKDAAKYWANWTRLRNAVYVTYPMARSAGFVMVDVNKHLEKVDGKGERKAYIKSREKELRAAFGDKVSDLSIYQGKVLMKLINRQTGNNCFEIIKEMKGGFTAGFYQTLMFFAGTSLKQAWSPAEDKFDKEIDEIVQEIDRMYYGSPAYSSPSAAR